MRIGFEVLKVWTDGVVSFAGGQESRFHVLTPSGWLNCAFAVPAPPNAFQLGFFGTVPLPTVLRITEPPARVNFVGGGLKVPQCFAVTT